MQNSIVQASYSRQSASARAMPLLKQHVNRAAPVMATDSAQGTVPTGDRLQCMSSGGAALMTVKTLASLLTLSPSMTSLSIPKDEDRNILN